MSVLSFDGQVAIVTGAGSGLGRSHALLLAARGCQVVVVDPGGDVNGGGASLAADEVVAEIRRRGGIAVASHIPVGTANAARGIMSTALDAFGPPDILVNNAGILRDHSIPKLEDEEIRAVLEVHLLGALYLSREAFRYMRERGYGRIVSTTSASALGNFGQLNYAAAKAGLIGLTKGIAVEGGRKGVTANAIAPIARTRMTTGTLSIADIATPEAVSAVVAMLAHDSNPMNGRILSVGGRRVAEFFIGETAGVVLEESTPEAVLAALPGITDRAGFTEPVDLEDAIAIMEAGLATAGAL